MSIGVTLALVGQQRIVSLMPRSHILNCSLLLTQSLLTDLSSSLQVTLLPQRHFPTVVPWLDIDPVNFHHLPVLLVPRLDTDLTGKRESASGLEGKGSVPDPDWLAGRIPHVDIEGHFLKREVR